MLSVDDSAGDFMANLIAYPEVGSEWREIILQRSDFSIAGRRADIALDEATVTAVVIQSVNDGSRCELSALSLSNGE
jgi:hypothetical protein